MFKQLFSCSYTCCVYSEGDVKYEVLSVMIAVYSTFFFFFIIKVSVALTERCTDNNSLAQSTC